MGDYIVASHPCKKLEEETQKAIDGILGKNFLRFK